MSEDKFKSSFKYYKSKHPKPSFQEVITTDSNQVTRIDIKPIEDTERSSLLGLKCGKLDVYTIGNHPGLLLIQNPFTAAGQRYWIRKCLEVYPRKPNKTNIEHEMALPDWWRECHRNGTFNKVLLKKLRWTTLGYHHNWDTKQYTEENQSPFPDDLAELSAVVAEHIGLSTFKAEAAIVNYYHMDSTLAPHTDHSEYNLDAPLFSFSFGQSAIFLIGGQDKSTEPSAILLQSGDIVVMSREARLSYHAVPKILPAEEKPWMEDLFVPSIQNHAHKTSKYEKELTKINHNNENNNMCKSVLPQNDDSDSNQVKDLRQCSSYGEKVINEKPYLNSGLVKTMLSKDEIDEAWHTFASYVEESRINMNIRQVLNDKQKCLQDL